ncbi:MAG: hypothetical protein COA45_01230 [Zetaproteobacteria bacterium]|nr:MAG: hypothetical protein COA45_01230 [Zetaproteobacteria bacterium]
MYWVFVWPGFKGWVLNAGGRAIGVLIPWFFLVFSEFLEVLVVDDSAFFRCKRPSGLHAVSRPKNSVKHRLRAIFLYI